MSDIFDITSRLQDNFQRVETILRNLESKPDNPRAQIQAAAELRKHIQVARATIEAAVNQQAIEVFKEVVLKALDVADSRVRISVMKTLAIYEKKMSAIDAHSRRVNSKPNYNIGKEN